MSRVNWQFFKEKKKRIPLSLREKKIQQCILEYQMYTLIHNNMYHIFNKIYKLLSHFLTRSTINKRWIYCTTINISHEKCGSNIIKFSDLLTKTQGASQ